MKKRCEKGKPCGATCIDRRDHCLKDAAQPISTSLSKTRDSIQSNPYTMSPSVKDKSYTFTTGAQVTAKGILNSLQQEAGARRINGEVKEGDINWRSILGSGSSYVGGGGYGSFVSIPSEKLIKEESRAGIPRQVGVKAGRIGANEVEALRIVGANDLGPRLLGARLSSRPETDVGGNLTYSGVVAMTKVPALAYKRVPEVWGDLGTKSDIYWKAMAGLHRLGIAHNDMHGGNVFIDSRGKGRFVDFGLAQISVKAALAEALGSMNWENWQFSASPTEGLARVARRNLRSVEDALARKGLNPGEISSILEAGIRNEDSYYRTGAWRKISDQDAKELIDIFYGGIG